MRKYIHRFYIYVRVVGGLALLLLLVVASYIVFFPSESLPESGPASGVIVLGAAPNSPAIRQRATQGLSVYQNGFARNIVLSGGKTYWQDESEAQNMARYLTKATATTLPIVLEEASTDTYENIRNSLVLLPWEDGVVIVSDVYHVPRAVLVAKRLGYDPVYWSSPSSRYYRPAELVGYYMREIAAIIWYIPRLVKS